MSSNDNIPKPFESVPKLSGKENNVVWKQRLALALLLTRSNSFINPNTKAPADSSLDSWTDRDNQVAAAILSTTSESIFSAHIDHLKDLCSQLGDNRSSGRFISGADVTPTAVGSKSQWRRLEQPSAQLLTGAKPYLSPTGPAKWRLKIAYFWKF